MYSNAFIHMFSVCINDSLNRLDTAFFGTKMCQIRTYIVLHSMHINVCFSFFLENVSPSQTKGCGFSLILIKRWKFFGYYDTGLLFLRLSPKARDIQTYCKAFGSRTVATCFNDSGMSQPGLKLSACETNHAACATAKTIRHNLDIVTGLMIY